MKTALVNDWSAIMWHDGTFYDGPSYPDLEIEDRVGGGDGFASGFTYGFLTGKPPQECVDLGVAHGALLMSTRGDTSQITLDELHAHRRRRLGADQAMKYEFTTETQRTRR